MNITVAVESQNLNYALARLANAARVDLGLIIKQEGGNVAKTIMQILPPTTGKTSTAGGSPSGLSSAAKEQGQNAIKGDLFGGKRSTSARYSSIGLFQRINGSSLVAPQGASQTVGVRLGWEQSKKIRIMSRFWRPQASVEEMRAFHKRYQNNRGRTGFVSQSTIGRWKVQDQMWIENSAADKYFNLLKSRVGWAKAGFASAAIACGIRVPAWITRHASSAGTTHFNFGRNPYIIATATKTKIPDTERFVVGAMNLRVGITQKKIDRLLANKAVNLGFAKVSGAGEIEYNKP